MNEFIQKFQERTHKLKMEKQKLFFENHEMQEEMRKSNVEIQQMTAELSEMGGNSISLYNRATTI